MEKNTQTKLLEFSKDTIAIISEAGKRLSPRLRFKPYAERIIEQTAKSLSKKRKAKLNQK